MIPLSGRLAFTKSVFTAFSLSSIVYEPVQILPEALKPEEVLIKVKYAPLNPLDLTKLSGKSFPIKPPFTLGSEGSGQIVFSKNPALNGKYVSFIVKTGAL
jgi:NADPH:quinone reductase-like Zn-dependent oxidoreductase